GLAAAIVKNAARRSEQTAARVDDSERVVAGQTVERKRRGPAEAHELSGDAVGGQLVGPAVGARGVNDQRVVVGGAVDGDPAAGVAKVDCLEVAVVDWLPAGLSDLA